MRSVQSISGLRVVHVGAVLSLLALGGCGAPDSAQLLSRAAEAEAEGRYRAAAIDLRTAVAQEPQNSEARFRLGLMALQLGDAATAEKELRRARELGYQEGPTLEPTAKALLELSRARQALAELAQVTEPTANSEALTGRAHEQLGEQDYALRAYARALALDGDNEDALLGTARFASAKGDRDAAERALKQARQTHPNSLKVALDYGRFLLLTQRPEEAEAVLTEAFAAAQPFQSPVQRGDVLVSLAEAQLTQAKLEAAAETAQTLLTVRPDDVLATYIDARIAYAKDDLALANELVARVVVEAPEFDPAQKLQATVHLARGEYTQARLVLERLVVRRPDDAEARRLLDAAMRGVAELDDDTRRAGRAMSQSDLYTLMGNAQAEAGDFRAAVTFWEQALKNDPRNQDVKLELLGAYLTAGETERVKTMLEETTWIADFARERVGLIDTMLSLRENDVEGARRKALAAAERFPKSAPTKALQGLIEVRDDPAAAKTYFEAALALDPASTTAIINLASLADLTGETPGGIAILQEFVKANPKDAIALEALATRQLRAGDRAGAAATLEQARSADDSAVGARLQLAQVLIEAGDFAEAEVVARELTTLRPRLSAGHNALGIALIGQRQLRKGTESLRTALRITPTALDPLRNLLRAEMAMAEYAQAQDSVDRLLALAPQDTAGLEAATRLALARGELEAAEQLLDRYVAAAPEASLLPSLVIRGDIARARSEPEQALVYYEDALARQPSPPLVDRVFGERQRLGREDAEDVLVDWLASNPQDQGVRLLLAQSAQLRGDFARAEGEYQRILAAAPRSLVAWNNLALLYQATADGRAVQAAQQAYDLAPDSPAVADTYGWILIQNDQVDNGVALLRDAWEAAPGLSDIGYHLAVGLVRRGEVAEARAVLEQALGSATSFSSEADARRLLQDL